MAQPTPYDRQYSFATFQSQSPSDPLPGDQVDAELNAVKATTDEIISNLDQIQRDDGQLANSSVGLDQLKPEVSTGVQPAVMWLPDTAFGVNAIVFYGVVLYRCTTAHTSTSVFDPTKFLELADFSSIAIPPGAIGPSQLQSSSVGTVALQDSSVTPAKMGGLPGVALMGRYSSASGGVQFIALGAGLSFSGNTLVASTTVADGSIATAKLANNAVTAVKCVTTLVTDLLGFTPINRGGDANITGVLQRNGQGAHLWHGGSHASGQVTLSTSDPSGGADGDIWFKYTP